MKQRVAVLVSLSAMLICTTAGLVGCGESIDNAAKRNIDWAWVVGEDGIGYWIATGPNKPRITGDYTVFYSSGEIYETGFIRDGIHEDTSTIYDKSGMPIHYIIYEGDDQRMDYYIQDGAYKELYQDGSDKIIGEVKDHKPFGHWKQFTEDGKINLESNMQNGTGWEKAFYENGAKKDSAYYVNGVQNGVLYAWYEDGTLQQITNWKNKLQDSLQVFYNPDGSLMQVEMKKLGKLEDSSWIYWPNGNVKCASYFVNGNKHGGYLKYHENGNIELIAKFNYGARHGEWRWHDSTGKLIQVDYYNNDELIRSVEK